MKAATRRTIRQAALEALYEAESSNHDIQDALERRLEALAEEDPDVRGNRARGIGRRMIDGVFETISEADVLIGAAAPRYPIETMAVVDRNILRLAIWELLTDAKAPVGAVVNEAVELAHMYSGGSSPAFVNGVLRTIAQQIEGKRHECEAPPAESTPDSEE